MHSSAPPPPPPEARGSVALRIGAVVGTGAFAALACSVPAALRVAKAGQPAAVSAIFALGAAALVPMMVSVVVLRKAREGLKMFAGPNSDLHVFGVGLWFATLLVALSIFGSFLRATTHHHALAGVTYAFGALAFAVGDAFVCARFVGLAALVPEGGRRILLGSVAAAAGILLFAVGIKFVGAASRDEASYAAAGTVVDVLAFVLVAVFASRLRVGLRRPLAFVGPPVALVVMWFGARALHDPVVNGAVAERAPAFVPASDLLSGH